MVSEIELPHAENTLLRADSDSRLVATDRQRTIRKVSF